MTWTAYRVVFKLKSPLHIGCGKVGNVQRTRPYVTGRSFWGALTMRLTRNECEKANKPATNSEDYQKIGETVHKKLAYTYFYPTENEDYSIEEWPWVNKSLFRRRFLSSYASTALVYPQQAADEGLLHEVEFISPRTLDEGKQVYLVGYVFERESCDLNWEAACQRLQMGGDRGYGWGDLQCVEVKPVEDRTLFKNGLCWEDRNDNVVITIPADDKVLAHTATENVSVKGEIEPLVGREWRSHNQDDRGNPVNCYAGQYIEFTDLCWVPGSVVEQSQRFAFQNFGIWKLTST